MYTKEALHKREIDNLLKERMFDKKGMHFKENFHVKN